MGNFVFIICLTVFILCSFIQLTYAGNKNDDKKFDLSDPMQLFRAAIIMKFLQSH